MKLLHLSDLHLGKRVNEFSMLEDQTYILRQILEIVDEEAPDGVLIAGDVYDKSVPSAEAVQLFDDFLCRLAKRNLHVFVISGNHDSPERLAFGGRLMERSGIHMSPVYDGHITPISLEDQWGTVDVYMLPFVKPANVRRFYPEETIESYTDGIRVALGGLNRGTDGDTAGGVGSTDGCAGGTSGGKGGPGPGHRRVLVTHQFVTGAARSESEEISVGGSDNVDGAVFADFDYVALGHIHGPQNLSADNGGGKGNDGSSENGGCVMRYCGTPLKYSFSEAGHEKSVTVVELREKGNLTVRTIPLKPKRDLREIRGSYMELTDRRNYEGTATEDYLHITLTDEDDVPDAIGKLRVIYPNLMKLDYDNQRTRTHVEIDGAEDVEQKTPLALFSEFFEKQNNQPMSAEQTDFLEDLIQKIWEDRP